MIITRLAGGIGNQMFHYAVARSCQRSPSERIVLDDRLLRPLESDIEKIVQRPYALHVFPRLKATRFDPKLDELLNSMRFTTRVRRRLFKANTETVSQQYLEPVAIGRRRTRHLWLIGNFQSETHFERIRDTLIDDFTFPPMDARNQQREADILSQSEALCVHLRRGDYLSSANKSVFDSVTLDYYRNALQTLTARVPLSSLVAYVFSDDMAWAKAHFAPPGLRLEFIDGNDAESSWKDMRLMASCRHHIIANSSFSWWGAWLSTRGGETFLPRHWFRPDTYPYQIEHIAPRRWHVVDYALP